MFVRCTDCVLSTQRIGVSYQWKRNGKITFKSVIGGQRTAGIWEDAVYDSVAGEGKLAEILIFIKTSYKKFTQFLVMVLASDPYFCCVWWWKTSL